MILVYQMQFYSYMILQINNINMKKISFILIYVLCFLANAKSQDTCFTKKQILNIYNNIKVLEHKDSIQNTLLSEYQLQMHDFKSVMIMDSTTISGQTIQIENLQQNCKDLKDICKQVTPQWFEKPLFVSILTAIGTIFVLKAL